MFCYTILLTGGTVCNFGHKYDVIRSLFAVFLKWNSRKENELVNFIS